jgi:hypothetical protein
MTAAAPEPGTNAAMAVRVAALLLLEVAAARINAANGIATTSADLPPLPPPCPERMDGQELAASSDRNDPVVHTAPNPTPTSRPAVAVGRGKPEPTGLNAEHEQTALRSLHSRPKVL